MRSLFLLPFIFFAGVTVSHGDIVMKLDLDITQSGIQTAIDVTVGQTITAGVVMEITASSVNGLSGYSMTVLFDSDKLDLGPNTLAIPNPNPPPFGDVFVNRRSIPPPNFSTLGDQSDAANKEGPIAPNTPPISVFYANTGAFYNVAAGASSGGIGPGTNVRIFEFTLTATQAGTISSNFAGDPSVVLALVKPSDGFLDALNNPIPFSQIQGVAGPVAVPEPSTLAFLGLGTLLVAGRRYKRRKQAAATKT